MDYLLKKELSTAEKYKDNVFMLISCKIIREEMLTSQSFLDACQLYVGQQATKLWRGKKLNFKNVYFLGTDSKRQKKLIGRRAIM